MTFVTNKSTRTRLFQYCSITFDWKSRIKWDVCGAGKKSSNDAYIGSGRAI